ncbi:hypothetical protein EJB05_00086, partial [Eragrostis curvula]
MEQWLVLLKHAPVALTNHISSSYYKLVKYFDPYLQITISEYGGAGRFHHNNFFKHVEAYLSDAFARHARKFKVELSLKKLQVSVDDHEEVTDSFGGATFWWYASKTRARVGLVTFYPPERDEQRYYRLVFHRSHRDLVFNSYLPHVHDEGRAAILKNRQRRLFTNKASSDRGNIWSHVPFEHPSTFDTLAMDPHEKEAIRDDLLEFMESKDYYAKIGKPWKRGYLLYGPPGTGKSTMIAAMANLLDYDVYDLELTAVKNNTDLRKLFIETTGKSIIVIEDIDCSLSLTGKRMDKSQDDDDDGKPKPPILQSEKDDGARVTLSGLLNFIDGLWSACGGERIIIFTTNHLDKVDPALIRRGRMDKHIEMSYCTFEAFKILADNYLGIGEHELFGEIRQLLNEMDMTAADVAENLMPRSKKRKRDPDACLAGLVEAMKMKKAKMQDAAAKAKEEEEANAKAEVEAEAKEKEEAEAEKRKAESEGNDKTSDSKAAKVSNGYINGVTNDKYSERVH